MKLRAIRVHDVGLFKAPVAVENLSGRLDVLAGPNELGKSTLVAAVRAVLWQRHTTTSFREIEPYGGGHPLIEIDFETGLGGAIRRWRLAKRYSTSTRTRFAELCEIGGGGLALRGPAAEERLDELIGASQKDPGRLGLLLVGQAEALRERIAPDGSGAQTLRSAIEREIESVAGGSRLREVRAAVQAQLDQHLTATGRPKAHSAYAAARLRRDGIATELAAARQARQALRERFDGLEQAIERQRVLDQTAQPATLIAAREAARQALEAARQAEQLHATAREAHAVADRWRQALGILDGRMQELADIEAARRSDETELALAVTQADAARTDTEAEEAKRRHADGEMRRLSDLAQARASADAALQRAQRAAVTAAALASAQAEADRIAAAERALAGLRMTAQRLTAIETAAHAAELHAARIAAATTTVRIDYAAGAEGAIHAAGRPLAGGVPIEVDGTLRLDIPGIGRVLIAAGASSAVDGADGRRVLDETRTTLARLLADAGAADVTEAQGRRAERATAEQQHGDAAARLKALAPQGIERLAQLAREFDGAVGASPAPGDLPAAERIAELIATAREAQDAAGTAHQLASASLRVSATIRDRLTARLSTRAERSAVLQAQLPLPAVRADERARLARLIDEADGAASAARLAAQALSPTAPGAAEFARLAAQHALAAERLDARQTEAHHLSLEITRLEAALGEALDGGAPDQRGDALEGALAAAESTLAGLDAEIAALKLLATDIDAVQASARSRYQAPVTERITPLLQRLLGEAQLAFDDALGVTGLTRGGTEEAIERLSGGTREQIAVIVRLGFGRLLADTGLAAPLLLDDPLVFSDDRRMERMLGILTEAAEHHQVIVLTCREAAFAGLHGTRLTLQPWERQIATAAE